MINKIKQRYFSDTNLYLLITAAVLLIMLASAWYAMQQRQQSFTARLSHLHQLQLNQLAQLNYDARQQVMLSAQLVAADQQIKQLLLSAAASYRINDQETELGLLRAQALPLLNHYWQTLLPYGASQLHLHLAPDAYTFLRAHRPERHSDRLADVRPLVMQSLNSGESTVGIELGRHGLGQRAVVPVTDQQGKVQGAVEFGVDLQKAFLQVQAGLTDTGSDNSSAIISMALLVVPDITDVLNPELQQNWYQSEYWSTPASFSPLRYWLDSNALPQQLTEARQLQLSYDDRDYLVSLLPIPVWGENQPEAQLLSISWQDVTAQIYTQQKADNLIWLIWLAATLLLLALGLVLVSHLRRQAQHEVADQQALLRQSDLTPERYAEAEQQQLKALTETGRYGPYIKQYRHKNGELIDIELNGVLFSDAQDEKFIWTIIKDISDIKRIEKLKDDFVSTVSHELRTPLTSIGGSLGLVLGGIGGELSPKAEKLLTIAHKNSQRLNILINDLLDIDKLTAGKLRFEAAPVFLPKLLQDAIEHNQPVATQHAITLNVVSCPPVHLLVDAARIQQVLTNLLSNAIKFSPANAEVSLAAEITDERVRISVQDQGPGISDVDQQRLFQRFSQLDQNTEQVKSGTGLGLAISREIVLQSGGEIGVSSCPGEGATFWLELPLYRAALPVNSPDAILVIEDDPDTAHLLCEFLRAEQYQADWVADSQAAWQKMAERKYAAITLDLKLQNENGADFFLRLRDNPATENLPVLVISAHIERGKLQLAALANAIDWIEKPVSPEILSLKLGQLLSQLPRQERNHRILHVEDDSDIVAIMRLQLENQCEYFAVATLSQARATLGKEHFDLILLDLGLPDGNGISLLTRAC